MTSEILERMPAERRRLLVHTAALEFSSAGYEQASLNRIIKTCGLSKSSFYYFIASKRELFDLTVSDLTAELAEQVNIPDPSEFSGDRFWVVARQFFDHLIDALERDRESFTALGRMFYLSGIPDDHRSAIGSVLADIEGWLERVLAAGRESGQIRDDLPVDLQRHLVFSVLRALDEWTVARISTLAPTEAQVLAAAQFDTIRRMLR